MSTSTSENIPDQPSQPRRTTKETHPNLPPGLILDANGKVCKVCNSWQDWGRMKIKKKDDASTSGSGEASMLGKGKGMGMGAFAGLMSGTAATGKGSTTSSTPSAVTTSRKVLEKARRDCPPDTAELGRSTWTFLHTTAAYYPLSAPPLTQQNMLSLLSSLSLLYPCNWCATDFQKDIRRNPPDVSGREGLMKWLCERHNEVNDKLGKDKFDCSVKNLDTRWKDGPDDGRCD